MEFLSLKSKSFGLDISRSSLRMAMINKKGKFFNLSSWSELKLEKGVIEEGKILNEEKFISGLRDLLKTAKGSSLKTRDAIISLPEEQGFLQIIQVPKMKEEELKTAIFFEAENYIPININDVYIDFQTIPTLNNNLDHLDVLLAAFPKEIIDSYVRCLKKADIFPIAMELESQAISRAVVKNNITAFPIFIIDFGEHKTNLIIFSGHSLHFTASMSVCAGHLTQAISNLVKVDLAKAEQLKLKYGLQFFSQEKNDRSDKSGKILKEVGEAMVPTITDLIEQIKKCINYYQTHSKHEHLPSGNEMAEKIVLCGKGANLKGLAEFFQSEFGVPVELGNPWINILPEPLKEVPGLSYEESLGYATSLGLALRGIKENL
jgi:type IV pilus assembly protein PilM